MARKKELHRTYNFTITTVTGKDHQTHYRCQDLISLTLHVKEYAKAFDIKSWRINSVTYNYDDN